MARASATLVGRRRTSGAHSEEVAKLPPQSEEVCSKAVRVADEDAFKNYMHIAHLIGVQMRGRGMSNRNVTAVSDRHS